MFASVSGATPGALHSATISIFEAVSPRRMKHRVPPIAPAVSATVTPSSSSRSCCERTSSEMRETRRSRSSASVSATDDAARARARPACEAKACITASSAASKARGACVPSTSTPTAREPAKTGAKAALLTPARSSFFDTALDVDRVEDSERRLVAERGRDAARLLLEIECQPLERGHVLVALTRGNDPRRPAVRIDQGQGGHVHAEKGERLVRDQAPDRLGVTCPGEILRQAVGSVGVEALQVVERQPGACEQQPTIGPAAEEDDRWDRGDDDREERQPQQAGQRLPVDQDADTEDRGGEANGREDEGEAHARVAQPDPLSPNGRQDCRPRSEIQRREREQRHRVEQHRLGVSIHWALRMIERGFRV